MTQRVKNLPTMQESWILSLGWEDPLEEDMATHSSILSWKIPLDRGAWQDTVHGVAKSQTHDWATSTAAAAAATSLSRVQLCATPEMAAHQAPPSLGFSRQEHWSGLPFHMQFHLWRLHPHELITFHRLHFLIQSPEALGSNMTLQFSSIQLLSHVQLFAIRWIAARQASLSITKFPSSLKLMSIESVMPSSHLILCRPLLLLPPIPPSIRVFSIESTLCIRWPKYWSFSFRITPSNEYPGLISFRMDWLDLLAVQKTLKSLL